MRIIVKHVWPDGKKLQEIYMDNTETRPVDDVAQGSTLMELDTTEGSLTCCMFSEGAGDWIDIGGGSN